MPGWKRTSRTGTARRRMSGGPGSSWRRPAAQEPPRYASRGCGIALTSTDPSAEATYWTGAIMPKGRRHQRFSGSTRMAPSRPAAAPGRAVPTAPGAPTRKHHRRIHRRAPAPAPLRSLQRTLQLLTEDLRSLPCATAIRADRRRRSARLSPCPGRRNQRCPRSTPSSPTARGDQIQKPQARGSANLSRPCRVFGRCTTSVLIARAVSDQSASYPALAK